MTDHLKTILVDFDGVLHSYKSGWQGSAVIPDLPNYGAIDWLKKMLCHSDLKICIYSSRSRVSAGVTAMKDWLLQYGMNKRDVARLHFPIQKPAAWLTIDDRAWWFRGEFPSYEQIADFRPWWKPEGQGPI